VSLEFSFVARLPDIKATPRSAVGHPTNHAPISAKQPRQSQPQPTLAPLPHPPYTMPFADTPAPNAVLVGGGDSTLVAHAPFEVLLHAQRTYGACAPSLCVFDRRFPMRLRGKMEAQEFADMVGDIEERLNEAIADANRVFQQHNLPALAIGICTLGIGMMFVWPLWIVGNYKASQVLSKRVTELREWIDEQNEQYWVSRGLQFGLTQTVIPITDNNQQYNLSASFTVR